MSKRTKAVRSFSLAALSGLVSVSSLACAPRNGGDGPGQSQSSVAQAEPEFGAAASANTKETAVQILIRRAEEPILAQNKAELTRVISNAEGSKEEQRQQVEKVKTKGEGRLEKMRNIFTTLNQSDASAAEFLAQNVTILYVDTEGRVCSLCCFGGNRWSLRLGLGSSVEEESDYLSRLVEEAKNKVALSQEKNPGSALPQMALFSSELSLSADSAAPNDAGAGP